MILHELTTNAVKYGALSLPQGRVLIAWKVETEDSDRRIALDWTESGGPTVEEPSRRGQGTQFIERSIGYELRGKATITFAQEGLHAMLSFPLTPAILPVMEPLRPSRTA